MSDGEVTRPWADTSTVTRKKDPARPAQQIWARWEKPYVDNFVQPRAVFLPDAVDKAESAARFRPTKQECP
eukprot:2729157-Pleurochrysis_carterae.AAC.1